MAADRRDPYEVLGISRDAGAKDISRAYRAMARQHHPDVSREPDAADRFKEIQAAYDVLKDPEKRQRYDQFGWRGLQSTLGAGFGGVDIPGFGDIFDVFFGRGGRRADSPQRGRDLQQRIQLDFVSAVHGQKLGVTVNRQELCDDCGGNGLDPGSRMVACEQCGGTGEVRTATRSILGQFVNITGCRHCGGAGRVAERACDGCQGAGLVNRERQLEVDIPGGVDNGTEIRISGQGDSGINGGPPGDLYLVVAVEPHPSIARQGRDLQSEIELSVSEAVLGVEIEVETVDGPQAVEFAAGTQPGEAVRLAGRGAPSPRDQRRGDHYVMARVTIPRKLTKQQRALFEQLAEEEDPPPGLAERLRQALS